MVSGLSSFAKHPQKDRRPGLERSAWGICQNRVETPNKDRKVTSNAKRMVNFELLVHLFRGCYTPAHHPKPLVPSVRVTNFDLGVPHGSPTKKTHLNVADWKNTLEKSACCHFPGTCAKHWELHGESFWIKTSAKFSSCCSPCKLRADENDMVHCLLNPFRYQHIHEITRASLSPSIGFSHNFGDWFW